VPGRAGNVLVGYSPGNLYETNDGYVYIASNLDKQAHAAFAVIGREDLCEKEGFRTRAERWQNRAEVDRIVEAWTRERAKRDVFEQMIAADVPCGIVLDIAEVLEDEDLLARSVFADVDHPGLGRLRLPRSPIVFGDQRADARPAPLLGQDNNRLYRELLGYDEERIARLVAAGVITSPSPGSSSLQGTG
jgi:crotonobetainyl-CoA:carnitine CoA-transferase CaiB-like acyl-CoA transferase